MGVHRRFDFACGFFRLFFGDGDGLYHHQPDPVENQAAAGSKRAALVLRMAEDYDRLLSTILIGNNIVNIASASIATVVFVRFLGDKGVTISTVVMTVVVLIFGEISRRAWPSRTRRASPCWPRRCCGCSWWFSSR